MSKENLPSAEELRKKGLNHLAELLEAKVEDEEDEPEFDDEDKEKSKKDDEKSEEEVKEGIESVLNIEGADKEKIKGLFEAAVAERVAEQLASLEESVAAKIEAKSAESDALVKSYLDFVVEGWVKEQEPVLVKASKVELAESMLCQLKAIFEEHSFLLESDEKHDALEESKNEVASVRGELNDAVTLLSEAKAEIASLKQEIFGQKVAGIIDSLSEGMTQTQSERFSAIVGETEVDIAESLETIEQRLKVLKDAFIAESVSTQDSEIKIEESVVEQEVDAKELKESKPALDPKMALYVKAIGRNFSANKR